MRRSLAILAASAVGVTLIASPASADWQWWDPPLTIVNSTTLLDGGYSDMAVSAATGQIFVANGITNSTITVFDLDGQVVDTIDGQAGARGLELSADGSTLYAALYEGGAVTAIDVATRTETTRWTLAPDACPYDLALAADRLWFSQGCGGEHGKLSSLDPASPDVAPVLDQGGYFTYAPRLESGGTADTLLFAMVEWVFPNRLISFDLSSGQPVRRTSLEHLESVAQFKVDPDGRSIIVVTPGEYQFTSKVARYSTADLTEVIRYEAPGPVISVTFAADGRVATHADNGGLAMFAPDSAAPLWSTYRLFSPGMDVARRGLAIGAEGRFYAAARLGDGAMALTTVDVGPVDTAFAVDNPVLPVLVRKPYTITGRLSAADSSPIGARTIRMTRYDAHGSPAVLPDVTVDAGGRFSVTDTPKVVGDSTWVLTFDGTDRLLPSTYAVTLPVTRR